MFRTKLAVPILIALCVLAGPASAQSYFPIQTKPGQPGVTASQAQWYGKFLEKMKEPRLPEAASDATAVIYRLTILPTAGNPIAVRAQKLGTLFNLAARRLDGQGGSDPGKSAEEKDVQLSEADSSTLESTIAQLKFFEMPTDEHLVGADGEEWILEGVAAGKYHVIHRWCASSHETQKRGLADFVALCKF